MNIINDIETYLRIALGVEVFIHPLEPEEIGNLPIFLKGLYALHGAYMLGQELVLVEPVDELHITAAVLEKQFQLLHTRLQKQPVLITKQLPAVTRSRLVQKGINFIVLDKQVHLPGLLVTMKQRAEPIRRVQRTLTPSAQVLLLFALLHRESIGAMGFRQLAERLRYSPMMITLGVAELQVHGLTVPRGVRNRKLEFTGTGKELWEKALPLLADPVWKRVFVDEPPEEHDLLVANVPALARYSDIDEGRQPFFAIGKKAFIEYTRDNRLVNLNTEEGRHCLEVWKYNPAVLTDAQTAAPGTVDPLSLYISLRQLQDERIEMALEHMIEKLL